MLPHDRPHDSAGFPAGKCNFSTVPRSHAHSSTADVRRPRCAGRLRRDRLSRFEWHGLEQAARYLRGYFIANQSIHVLTRIEHLEFPTDGEARAQVLVGTVGREAAATDRWDLAADLHTFKIALRRKPEAWKVTFLEVARK